MRTKVLFVWPGLTGYMGDCWRELSNRSGIELKVIVDTTDTWFGGGFKAEEVLRGLDWATELPRVWCPDVVFAVGWRNRLCRDAVLRPDWRDVPKVCCFDMPWRWQFRCLAARFVLRDYLRHFNAAFIPGVVASRYAKWLGFERIYEGLFATNTKRFGGRSGGEGFLCVGRDVPDKGMDILRAAHSLYRSRGGTLPLRIVSGIRPDALGRIYAMADCFVLASRWEPWGVVLAEACAAGLPIICTDACGARHEVVREGVNGLVVRKGSVAALANAMAHIGDLNGEYGRKLAEPYSCRVWSGRVLKIVGDLTQGKGLGH